MSNIKERILQLAAIKENSIRKFCAKIGISSTNFAPNVINKDVGVNVLINIFSQYPDINIDWLLFEKGDMLKGSEIINNVSEINVQYGKNIDYKEKYCEVLEKYYQLSEENKHLRSLLEKNKKLNSQHAQDATV